MQDKISKEKPPVIQQPTLQTPVTTVSTHLPTSATRFVYPSYGEMQNYAWRVSNFTTVALFTSASIVAVQSPIKTMLLNLSKAGTALPTGYTGGVFGLARALYAGTAASLSGSTIRTAYVTGAKGSKPVEEGLLREEGLMQQEEGQRKRSQANTGYVMSMALGDILVTQIPESLSQLKKVPGLLPTDFKWRTPHNAYKLMSGGFTPRYFSGMINFASLCLLEDKIATSLPIANPKMAHFTAGALSGMTAALVSYPFTSFKDYVLVRSTINNGLLYNQNSFSVLKQLGIEVVQSPLTSFKSFGTMALKQAPMRMGLTGVIFALVAGIGETLGNEPLKTVVPESYQPSAARSPYGLFAHKETPRLEAPKLEVPKLEDAPSNPQAKL